VYASTYTAATIRISGASCLLSSCGSPLWRVVLVQKSGGEGVRTLNWMFTCQYFVRASVMKHYLVSFLKKDERFRDGKRKQCGWAERYVGSHIRLMKLYCSLNDEQPKAES